MSDLHPLPIGADRVTTGEETIVRVPVRRRGARPGARRRGRTRSTPRSRPRRPRCGRPDARVPAGRDPRRGRRPRSRPATRTSRSASRPRRPSRSRPRASRPPAPSGTFRFAAVEARTLTGEMIPMDANDAGVGKLGFTLRDPASASSARSARSTSRSTSCRTRSRPRSRPAARWCSSPRRRRRSPRSCSPRSCSTSATSRRAGSTSSPAVAAASATRSSTTTTSRYITFTGSPEVGWGIKGRAPRKKVGLELGNNAPVIVEPDADLDLAATKIVAGGYGYSGQTCISVQRVYVHDSVRDELVDRVVAEGRGSSSSATRSTTTTDVSALDQRGRARPHRRLDRRGHRRAARRSRPAATSSTACSRPTVLTGVTARHEGVLAGGVRPAHRRAGLHRRRRRPSRWRTTAATGCRPRSSPTTCAPRCGPRTSSTSVASP